MRGLTRPPRRARPRSPTAATRSAAPRCPATSAARRRRLGRCATTTRTSPTATTASRSAPSTPPATPTTRRRPTPGRSTRSRPTPRSRAGRRHGLGRARRRSSTAGWRSAAHIARLECRLDGGDWGDCHDYADLDDGEHRFEVRAIDAAGNADHTPAAHTWTVDTVAPQTAIGAGPDAVTASRIATFTYSGDARGGTAIAGYECRLDDGAWGACAAYNDLEAGEHRFQVRAVDGAGNADVTPAAYTWTIDLTAPTTTITAKPDARTPEATRGSVMAATDHGGSTVAGLECRIDGQAFGPCTSPVRVRRPTRGAAHVRGPRGRRRRQRREPGSRVHVDDHRVHRRATTRRRRAQAHPVVIDVEANDRLPGPATIAADARSAKGGAVTVVDGGSATCRPPASAAPTRSATSSRTTATRRPRRSRSTSRPWTTAARRQAASPAAARTRRRT